MVIQFRCIVACVLSLLLLAGEAQARLRTIQPVEPPPAPQTVAPPPVQAGPSKLIENYTLIVHANYQNALAKGLALQRAVDALVKNSSQQTLDAARAAWIEAHAAYTPTEAYRFYGGPVDTANGGRSLASYLNAWPVDETAIDYGSAAQGGRIQNAGMGISVDELRQQHQRAVSSDITLGYHVIEYLLWGLDAGDVGPGQRALMDFSKGKKKEERITNERRRTYLTNATAALVQDLQALVNAWVPGQDNYAKHILAIPEPEAVGKILTGLATFASTTMANAMLRRSLISGSSRDESSRFSDTTKSELLANLGGIQAVYAGAYGTVKGESFSKRIEPISPTLEVYIYEQLEACQASLAALPDQFSEVRASPRGSDLRKNAEKAATDLLRLGELIRQLGNALGAKVDIKPSSAY